MKPRTTQFGARKNPDSPRVHGLRLETNSASSEQTSLHSVGDEPSPPSPQVIARVHPRSPRLPPREEGTDSSARMPQSRPGLNQGSTLVDIHEAAR